MSNTRKEKKDDIFKGRFIPLDHFPTLVSIILSPVPDESDSTPEKQIINFERALKLKVLMEITNDCD